MGAEKESAKSNFPLKCFFNDENHDIYCFYRDGQYFNTSTKDVYNFTHETLHNEAEGEVEYDPYVDEEPSDANLKPHGKNIKIVAKNNFALGEIYFAYNKVLITQQS